MSEENKEWEIVQTIDTITPGNVHFSEKSLRAKLMNKDGVVSSQLPSGDASLAHANSSMTCYACHTSWTPTCFGCHLQMTANARKPMLHNEGLLTKNYTSYNFQVLRDDIYMLGVDGTVTGHRIAPARSSCAVLVSSQNANRDWLYYTQQTISAPGFSGQAFSTFVPHTVRAQETKQCSDCHISAENDNNAWMAQLLLEGTNFMNFMGRYVYVATGKKGFEAIAVAAPTTLGVDPLRQQLPENEEQPIHLLYGFLYVADKEEGLVIIGDPHLKSKSPGVRTLLDGNPANNFLGRAVTFNPGGALTGARRITIAGTFAYILTDKALVAVALDNPLGPRITATVGSPVLHDPRGIAVQFRYAFVVDHDGLKVLDVTDLARPKPVNDALVPLEDARNVYVARTYAYVSAGKQGLAIVDVEQPDAPKLDQIFTAERQLNDVNDVKIGMVAASAFAFVADGKNGLRVLQILSPWDDPAHFSGFSPRPTPKLIATAHTRGPTLAISKGIDRDRAVDESGNQLAVFGRRGARPLNRAESQSLYLRGGQLYSVEDSPATGP